MDLEEVDGAVYEGAAELVRDFIAHVEALQALGLWELFRSRNGQLMRELADRLGASA